MTAVWPAAGVARPAGAARSGATPGEAGVVATRALAPFGLEVEVAPGTRWDDVPVAQLEGWLAAHRVVVLRGLERLGRREMPAAARRLGPLQAWPFGAINELREDAAKKNYLFTHHAVPLHYDGAFAGKVPRWLVFQCLEAPGADAGGETTFVDTTRVWGRADEATRDRWRALTFRYETERVAHYGGGFRARLVDQHPATGETVLRFAEPVDDLNPVRVRAEELSPLQSAGLITELRAALTAPGMVLAHRWRPGDVLVADNHALLHGRSAYTRSAPRHLWRVNVHGPGRGWSDDARDMALIRRPEFMVAEVPILLIAALAAGGSWGPLMSARGAALTALFFALFQVGDMLNCLADRDLDAVYKTHLSEAVRGLGVGRVRRQIAATAAAALGLGGWLAWQTGRPGVLGLVAAGLALGAAYSVEPVRLKGRGLAQVAALVALIFVGPMLLVAHTLAGLVPGGQAAALLGLFVGYGVMQQGTILVNTAEDLPEDEEFGVRTSAVALGLDRTLALALAMVAGGGAAVAATLGAWMREARVPLAGLLPLGVAWAWVAAELWAAWRGARGQGRERAMADLRPRARRMPLWITATAWGTLAAVVALRWPR